MILRLKGVKTVRAKGRLYYYHRKTMTPLPGAPGSAEFMRKLQSCAVPEGTTVPGALGALIALYKQSPEWRDLAASSQREYGKAFNHLQSFSNVALVDISVEVVYAIRDKCHALHSRSAANRVVTVLRLVFAWGMKRPKLSGCRSNPAVDVDKVRRPKDAKVVNRPWKDAELAVVLAEAAATPGAAWLVVPITIAAYAGLRESDVVRALWTRYDGTEFQSRQHKTGNLIWIRAHYRLREILDAQTRTSTHICVGIQGRPMSESSLRSRFFDFVKGLVERGLVEPGLSIHGLRHTLGTRLAEAGLASATIAAILGQRTVHMAEHYSRTAKRHGLATAGIVHLEEQDRNEERKTKRKTVV